MGTPLKTPTRSSRLAASPAPLALALEPRFMFDAAGVATAADAAEQQAAEDQADQAIAAAVASDPTRREVAFIDTAVEGWEAFRDGMAQGVDIVLLDGTRDGLSQIAAWAEGKSGYDAAHVFSHGGNGFLRLGTMTLNAETLQERGAEVGALGSALTDSGDVVLYGCSVAGDGAGQAFINALAAASGADVAASDDATGAAAAGGDWVLEAHSGSVESTLALTVSGQAQYAGLLGAPSIGTTDFNTATDVTSLASGTGTNSVLATDVLGTGWDMSATYDGTTSQGHLLRGGNNEGYDEDGPGGADPTGAVMSYDAGVAVKTTSVTFASNDGSEFDLNSLLIQSTQEATNVTITGYRDGGLVSGASVTATVAQNGIQSGIFTTVDLSGNDNFNNVDEFRITLATPQYRIIFDNISISAPSIPNAAPVVDLNGAGGANAASGDDSSASFTEGGPTALCPSATISDADFDAIQSMTLTLTNRPDGDGVESISLSSFGALTATDNSLTHNYDSSTGVLTISGSASAAVYQTILQGIIYNNSSEAPDTTNRSVSVSVNDGTTDSAVRTVTVSVEAVNDAPVVNGPGGPLAATEGTDLNLHGAGFSVSDVDAGTGTVTATLAVGEGTLTVAAGDSGVTINSGNGSGSVQISGTASQINALLTGTGTGTIAYATTNAPSASTSFTVTVNDGGNTGTDPGTSGDGASEEDNAAVTINLTAVNDAPTFTGNVTLPSVAEGSSDPAGVSIHDLFNGQFSDVDGDSLAGIAITDPGASGANGAWQYSIDGGTNWYNVAASNPTASNALLIGNDAANTRLRFVPSGDFNGTPASLTVHAVDNSAPTSFSSGTAPHTPQHFDTTTDDATSVVSAAGITVSTSISAVNDTPVATVPAGPLTVTEGTPLNVHGAGFSVSDVDSASGDLTVQIIAPEGSFSVAVGDSGVTLDSGNGLGTVQLTGTVAELNALLGGTSTGTITYATGEAPSASTTITLRVTDNGNTGADPGTTGDGTYEMDEADVTVTITAINDAPTLADLPTSITVTEDTAGNVDLSAVTFGDVDSGASAITLTIAAGSGSLAASNSGGVAITGSGTGTLTLTGTASAIDGYLNTASNIQYTGAANAYGIGADTLTLTANDGGNSGTGGGTDTALGTMSVNITAVADTPSVTNASTTPSTQTTSGLVISRNAADGAEVTHVKITGITNGTLYLADGTTQITNGSFITFAQANAGLKFTPSGSGDGSFDAQASTSNVDGGLNGSVVTASISVGVGVENPTIAEDTPSQAIDITRGDVSHSHFQISNISNGTLYSDAGLTTQISAGDIIASAGLTTTVYFVPTANFAGTANFSVQASTDGTAGGLTGNVATSTVTVTPVNDAPTLSGGTDTSINEGQGAYPFQGVTITDIDLTSLDGTTLTADLSAPQSGDQLSIQTHGGVRYDSATGIVYYDGGAGEKAVGLTNWNPATGTLTITFYTSVQGGVPYQADGTAVHAVASVIVYWTTSDDPTTDNATSRTQDITLTFNDNGSSGAGGALDSNTLTHQITVAPVNDAPLVTATTGTPTFTEGGTAVSLFSATTIDVVEAADLVAGLSFTVSNLVDGANEILTLDGTAIALTDGTNGTTAGNGYTYSVSVTSGTATVTIGTPGGMSTAAAATIANGATYHNTSETPSGTRTVTFGVQDTGGTDRSGADSTPLGSSTTVTINGVNDAPTISDTSPTKTVAEDGTLSFTAADFGFQDVDGDSLASITIATVPGAGTLFLDLDGDGIADGGAEALANGSVIAAADINRLRFMPQADANGTGYTSFTWTVNDGTVSSAAPGTMTIDVTPVNDAPTAGAALPAQTVAEDSAFTYVVPGTAFADVDTGDTRTLTAKLADNSPLPAWLSFNGTTFSGTPDNAAVGTLNIIITATDGGGATATQALSVTVTNTNDAPEVTGTEGTVALSPGQSISHQLSASLITDPDIGDTLTWTADTPTGDPLPTWLTFDPATRTFSGNAPNSSETVEIRVTATDGSGLAVNTTFTMTVTAPEPVSPGSSGSPLPPPPPMDFPPPPQGSGQGIGTPGVGMGMGMGLSPNSDRNIGSPVTGQLGSLSPLDIGGTPVFASLQELSQNLLPEALPPGLLGNEGDAPDDVPPPEEQASLPRTGQAETAGIDERNDATPSPDEVEANDNETVEPVLLGATPFTQQLALAQSLGWEGQAALAGALAAHRPGQAA